ncbi:redoxin domain-containing protein [Nocardioides sp.]|uniref:redoxin domain-containing protein n=1 Tax=Nocardioides sp. TaxID=35761 RepID=UPI002732ABB4|nr:redoxin domain-containing protein [Nocardioides sp.]MDP3892330.1 redoxin domain-containing protein [Nocardioides sp.]
MNPTETLHVPGDLTLLTPDGEPVRLATHLHRRYTVVQLVRYFGCLPCQEWLLELDRAADRFADLDTTVMAIGGSADYQARWLRDERGATLPMLLDPDQRFRDAVGAQQGLGRRLLDPRGMAAYAGSLRGGLRPQAITRDATRSPGVVVLGPDGAVHWRHIGQRIGDYPSLDVVLRSVGSLV